MHKQSFIKIHSLFLRILRKIEILTSIKDQDSAEKLEKMSCVGHTKFINFHQFVLKILNGIKILISLKGHNSVEK